MTESIANPPAGRHRTEERIGVLEELLGERYSCRAFRPDPVPRATIERILTAAQTTASWCNSQPWQVVIASGAGEGTLPQGDLRRVSFRRRRKTATFRFRANIAASIWSGGAKAAFSSTTRSASRAATRWPTPNRRWRISISSARRTSPSSIPTRRSASTARSTAAAMSRNFMLAAQALGLATIPQAALAFHSDLVRRHFGLGDDRRVVCGISFGFPDREHKVNSYRTTRAEHRRYRHVRRRVESEAATAYSLSPVREAGADEVRAG